MCAHLLLYVSVLQSALAYVAYEDLEFLRNITKGYDHRIRPVFNRSEEVKISLEFGLHAIHEVDVKKEVLVARGWFTISWEDKILRWNLSDETPSFLAFGSSEIWTPLLQIINSANNLISLKNGDEMVVVRNTGQAFFVFTGNFHTQCKLNTAKFPFDRQCCKIEITPFSKRYSKEYVVVGNKSLTLHTFENNGEWELQDTSLDADGFYYNGQKHAFVSVTINLKRRASFYIINTLLPAMLMSILNTFVFLLPEESGEKMTMSISILLSYAVFLSLITSYIPENSDNICFFSVYLVLLLVLSTMTCLATLFILVTFHQFKKGKDIPTCLSCIKSKAKNSIGDASKLSNQKTQEICGDYIVARANSVFFWIMFLLTFLVNSVFLLFVMT